MVKLSQLVAHAHIDYSGHDVDVRGLAYDSRQVEPGFLFVAIPGSRVDGREFIGEAVGRGAVAVVEEASATPTDQPIARVRVDDARSALARLANEFYGHPSEKLKLIGVTGTNGKTTTAYLLESILRRASMATGLIGTIEYRVNGTRVSAERTTPESLDLQRLLAEMVDKGIDGAVMEVSSHALDLKRIDGCVFAGRVFMNLSRDHLDYHGDMEAYFQAKARLFTDSSFGDGTKLVNGDDDFGRRLATLSEDIVTFGAAPAEYRPVDIDLSPAGTSFTLAGLGGDLEIRSPLLGAFNLTNLTAAAAAALELGIDGADVAAALLGMDRVSGRFEAVVCGQDFQVLIDYAHTPDGLEKVLDTARNLAGGNRVITVFGCGGDRDKGKRPRMGAIAAGLSDIVIVTSDNPRSEAPQAIIDDILEGFPQSSVAAPSVVVDRERAILAALSAAATGDVVIIAGKGHEDYQILNDKVIPFDDRLVAEKALRELLSDTN